MYASLIFQYFKGFESTNEQNEAMEKRGIQNEQRQLNGNESLYRNIPGDGCGHGMQGSLENCESLPQQDFYDSYSQENSSIELVPIEFIDPYPLQSAESDYFKTDRQTMDFWQDDEEDDYSLAEMFRLAGKPVKTADISAQLNSKMILNYYSINGDFLK